MMAMLAVSSMHPVCPHDVPGEIFRMSAMTTPDDLDPLLAYGATNDLDILYYHKAKSAPDREEFLKSMAEELHGQIQREVFQLLHGSQLPKNAHVLPAVWAMRRK